jgi:eukaryotic-like serine/threonine-protein kinase
VERVIAASTVGDSLGGPRVGMIVEGRYALKREIARGGGGVVFEATHLSMPRTVAIKLVDEQGRHGVARHRLEREARTLVMARHPNVVAVYDAGADSIGGPFLVLEMLEGRTLEGILAARRQLGISDAVHVGRQLCQALGFVHRLGIIHRDVKPNNIFLARDDVGNEVVKLLDFGIASLTGDAVLVADRKITQDNAVLGTPEYMAPERLMMSDEADARSDVYAVGVTLYECLTGEVPFDGNYAQVLVKVATQQFRAIRERRPDVSPALAAVVEKALAKDPADRHSDALSFASELSAASGLDRGYSALLGVGARPMPVSVKGVATAPSRAPRPDGKRRFARAPYVTRLHITLPDGSFLDSRSEDISEGGLLVFTTERCPDGATVHVAFALPLTGRIVSLTAVARWVRSGRAAGTVGLEFDAPPADVRAAIAEYVEAMGAQK